MVLWATPRPQGLIKRQQREPLGLGWVNHSLSGFDPLLRKEGTVMTWRGDWEELRRIGDYVGGDLSPKEACETERYISENTEGRRLANSYAQMLALLREISKETPDPPGAIEKRAVAHAIAHAMEDKNEEEQI